ncbi:MAG: VWA domain-containing protein [Alphaproteobacteria bacterium]|nr:VWA domain-containing protein [Alphaproteobacteria bacterium]
MHRVVALLALGLMGCQEYIISGDYAYRGKGEAPPLETPTNLDVISQTTIPRVDILWVVDNSCSMEEEQDAIATNFDAFMAYFLDSGLDWHIGVVSTDVDANAHSGKLRPAGGLRYLTPEVPDATNLFRQMVRLGTGGSADEAGLDATWLALAQPNADLQQTNAGFYRDDASLHVVVVSDENDYSTRVNQYELINFLQTLKPSADIPVTFSSIVGPAPRGCGSGLSAVEAGTKYLNVTAAVGGITESICVDDWLPVLEALGLQAAGLKREYFLTEVPVLGTVQVWIDDGDVHYDGIDLDTVPEGPTINQVCRQRELENCFGYAYDARRNSVVFPDFLPSPLASISIEYDLLKDFQPGLDEEPADATE